MQKTVRAATIAAVVTVAVALAVACAIVIRHSRNKGVPVPRNAAQTNFVTNQMFDAAGGGVGAAPTASGTSPPAHFESATPQAPPRKMSVEQKHAKAATYLAPDVGQPARYERGKEPASSGTYASAETMDKVTRLSARKGLHGDSSSGGGSGGRKASGVPIVRLAAAVGGYTEPREEQTKAYDDGDAPGASEERRMQRAEKKMKTKQQQRAQQQGSVYLGFQEDNEESML